MHADGYLNRVRKWEMSVKALPAPPFYSPQRLTWPPARVLLKVAWSGCLGPNSIAHTLRAMTLQRQNDAALQSTPVLSGANSSKP